MNHKNDKFYDKIDIKLRSIEKCNQTNRLNLIINYLEWNQFVGMKMGWSNFIFFVSNLLKIYQNIFKVICLKIYQNIFEIMFGWKFVYIYKEHVDSFSLHFFFKYSGILIKIVIFQNLYIY